MPSRWQRFSIRCGFGGCKQVCAATLIFGVLLQAVKLATQYTQRRSLKPKQSAFNISPPLLFHTLQHRSVIINLTPKLCDFVEASQLEGFLQLSFGVLNHARVEVCPHIKPRSCLPPQCPQTIDSGLSQDWTVYRRQKSGTHKR